MTAATPSPAQVVVVVGRLMQRLAAELGLEELQVIVDDRKARAELIRFWRQLAWPPELKLAKALLAIRRENPSRADAVALAQYAGNLMTVNLEAAIISDRERQVLKHRYHDGMTLDETAQALSVTKERVRDLENKGLNNLRTVFHHQGILAQP